MNRRVIVEDELRVHALQVFVTIYESIPFVSILKPGSCILAILSYMEDIPFS